ncbi:hypothetical protein ACFE04_009866 [Oxalis oulophora]
MRHFTSISPEASTASNGSIQWNTPLPYLFTGLLIVFGIIAVALFILACCQQLSTIANDHHDHQSSCDDKEKKSAKSGENPASNLPEIVVIMAGDDRPTFVAKPTSIIFQV